MLSVELDPQKWNFAAASFMRFGALSIAWSLAGFLNIPIYLLCNVWQVMIYTREICKAPVHIVEGALITINSMLVARLFNHTWFFGLSTCYVKYFERHKTYYYYNWQEMLLLREAWLLISGRLTQSISVALPSSSTKLVMWLATNWWLVHLKQYWKGIFLWPVEWFVHHIAGWHRKLLASFRIHHAYKGSLKWPLQYIEGCLLIFASLLKPVNLKLCIPGENEHYLKENIILANMIIHSLVLTLNPFLPDLKWEHCQARVWDVSM